MFGIDALTPTDFPRRFIRSRTTTGVRRGVRFTMVAAIVWLAASTISRAERIDYVFSNASAVLNGTPESITGLFTVDPTPQAVEWYAKILLKGAAPYAGLYSFTAFPLPLGEFDFVFAGGLGIRFANNLSFAADPLASVEINGVIDAAPSGSAVAVATPIDYVFSNASAVLNGTPESITGFFEFDPLTLIEYSALINLTGSPPYAGLYISDANFTLSDFIAAAEGPAGDLFINFSNNLSSTADPLATVRTTGPFADDPTPTGEAVPTRGGPIATPEPTSLAILGTAIGLFLLPLGGFAHQFSKLSTLFVQPVILHKNGVKQELTTLSGG